MRRNYAINLTLSAGLFMGETLSEVLFLSRYGVAALPLGLIATALIGLALTTAYTRALIRRPSGILLALMIVVVAALNLLIWGALSLGVAWAPLVFFLAFRPARDLLQAQIWNYFADQYDAQAAKQRFPVIGAAGRIGSIAGAAALPLLLTLAGAAGSILAWVGCLGLSLAALLSGRLRASARHAEPPRPALSASLTASPLARALTAGAALVVILVLLLTYQTSAALVATFADERQLGTIYASIAMVSNLAGWAFQTFALPPIIRAVGVSRTNLIYPVVALGVSLWIGFTGNVLAAIVGQVVRTTLRQSLQVPTEDLLMNALAPAIRARMRAIVRGAVVPLGATLGSLLILGLQALGLGTQLIPWMSVLVASATLVTALWVRRSYSAATMALAREQNPVAQRLAFAGFGSADPETIQMLEVRLAAMDSVEDHVFLGRILIDLDRVAGERALVSRIGHSPPTTQVALLGLLGESGIAGEPLLTLAPRLLHAPEPEVRRALLEALRNARSLAAPLYRRSLADSDAGVQLAAARLLCDAYPDLARQRLLALAASDSPELRAMVMQAVGADGSDLLICGLGDPAPQVRLAAASSAAALPNLANLADLLAALVGALADPVDAVRRAVVAALGRLGTSQTQTLVVALADRGPAVRAAASDAIIQIGPSALPTLSACLEGATSLDQREAALVTMVRLAPGRPPAELLAFELSLLERIVALVRLNQALGPLSGPVGTLLLADLAEEENALLDRLARLLAATNGDAAARSIWQGLAAPERERRAHASEALEGVRSPWQSRLIATLLRPDRLPDRVLALAAQRWPQQQLSSREAWIIAGEGSDWRRALVAAALAERDPTSPASTPPPQKGGIAVLSVVEKAIFLRAVPVFQAMAPSQLQILAGAGEELEYPRGSAIFCAGDPADRLFVVVQGRVGIEETRARGNVVRISTMEPREPFGELAVFDAPAHSTSAIAVDDCYLLAIRREVLLDLIGQHPDLSLAIIKFLSRRLRDASTTIAERTRARPRQLVDLFDKMGE